MLRVQVIATESEEADKVKSVVSLEEAAASKEAAGVKAIKVFNHPSCMSACCHHRTTSCLLVGPPALSSILEHAVKLCVDRSVVITGRCK